MRTFKLSTESKCAAKVEDIVGLYVDPSAHAVVLSIDEKSHIRTLDRTQPGLPVKMGHAGMITLDYKRSGTTTLFAALNVLERTVIERCMERGRHQEFHLLPQGAALTDPAPAPDLSLPPTSCS